VVFPSRIVRLQLVRPHHAKDCFVSMRLILCNFLFIASSAYAAAPAGDGLTPEQQAALTQMQAQYAQYRAAGGGVGNEQLEALRQQLWQAREQMGAYQIPEHISLGSFEVPAQLLGDLTPSSAHITFGIDWRTLFSLLGLGAQRLADKVIFKQVCEHYTAKMVAASKQHASALLDILAGVDADSLNAKSKQALKAFLTEHCFQGLWFELKHEKTVLAKFIALSLAEHGLIAFSNVVASSPAHSLAAGFKRYAGAQLQELARLSRQKQAREDHDIPFVYDQQAPPPHIYFSLGDVALGLAFSFHYSKEGGIFWSGSADWLLKNFVGADQALADGYVTPLVHAVLVLGWFLFMHNNFWVDAVVEQMDYPETRKALVQALQVHQSGAFASGQLTQRVQELLVPQEGAWIRFRNRHLCFAEAGVVMATISYRLIKVCMYLQHVLNQAAAGD